MHGKFIVYALLVSLVTTIASWGKVMSGGGSGFSSGSSWSSSSGSWGGGGGHK